MIKSVQSPSTLPPCAAPASKKLQVPKSGKSKPPIDAPTALEASRRAAGLPADHKVAHQPMGVTDEFIKRYVDGRVVPAEFRHW